jgi:predicted ABC-class ATPase
MRPLESLLETVRRLDGRGYRAYKEIAGRYDAGHWELWIDHVQGDPFAEPSRIRFMLPAGLVRLPEWAHATPTRRTAAADFLNRRLDQALRRIARPAGSGRSGELRVLRPGQQVLDRTSLRVAGDGAVEARLRVGLPARGRSVLGPEAARLLGVALPAAAAALHADAVDADALRTHVETVEDARALRAQLAGHGLVAFVADGAVLPRRSGVEDTPLEPGRATPFRAPDALRVELHAPNAGAVTGMGIRRGVTLIAGGGFHGKSTLLRAIERGIYDHVPGDGRERVVTVADAVKVRAEDGRAVAGTDISNFIGALPGGTQTSAFETANASGSTSQAAAIVEALETGTSCLLLDEDTSATNFMIRDARMQALIAAQHEPITPYIDRARQLADAHGVSTILVAGGSGDYFDIADCVIAMRDYSPMELTGRAREVAASLPTRRRAEGGPLTAIAGRAVVAHSLDPSRGHRAVHLRTFSEERILFGGEEVDLSAVEQLVEPAQARAIAHAIAWAREHAFDEATGIGAAVNAIAARVSAEGLDLVQREPTGELASFRAHELAAALNRIRSLRTRPLSPRRAGVRRDG